MVDFNKLNEIRKNKDIRYIQYDKEAQQNLFKNLNEMLEMQKVLDAAILKEKNLKEVSIENIKLALFDELGELNHELKPTWCWWKNHVGEVNSKRVLEELVDCWHFGLMITHTASPNFKFGETWYKFECSLYSERYIPCELSELYLDVIWNYDDHAIIRALCDLTLQLGFTMEDVYKEYVNKNYVNFERLRTGY